MILAPTAMVIKQSVHCLCNATLSVGGWTRKKKGIKQNNTIKQEV